MRDVTSSHHQEIPQTYIVGFDKFIHMGMVSRLIDEWKARQTILWTTRNSIFEPNFRRPITFRDNACCFHSKVSF